MPEPGARDWRILCGVIAGPVFVLAFLFEGATRADYNWLRHPVSSLALGEFGWMQVVNFLVSGALLVIFATALWQRSRWAAIFVGLAGIGLIGAGLFVTDPLGGYPPGTAARVVYTPLGVAHDVFSLLFFLGLPLACIVFAIDFFRTGHQWLALDSVLTPIGFLVLFVLAGIGFGQTPGWVEWGGLFQRLSIVIGFAWITVVALSLRTSDRPARAQ